MLTCECVPGLIERIGSEHLADGPEQPIAAWPDWPLSKEGKRQTVRPTGPLIADNSEALLLAAIEGVGITFTPDWLAGPAIRAGKLVEVLPGWGGPGDGGIHAILPPGRLVPTKTRVLVDEIAKHIKAGWAR
jgi:DNA-binding transcriptional LysR family regulator